MSDFPWWKKAVCYQIYPRSFYDTTGNGVGDLNGIRQKLDYLSRLGVDAIWISPFLKSPMADFGYDVSDYQSVDKSFGSNEDFENLLNDAQGRGIKIIMDLVLGHTSTEHPWFLESKKDTENSKADWYVWADTIPNNWVSAFGGSAWEWSEERQQYFFHNWTTAQADLNYHNVQVREKIFKTCRFWLNKGIDGLRLDVINYIYHDKELRNNPPKDPTKDGYATQLEKPDPYNDQWHIYDKSRPEALEFAEDFREMMNEYPNAMTLAEVGDDKATERAAEYVADNKRYHTAYSFSLMVGKEITASMVKNAVTDFFNEPGDGWPSWAFCNHDITRCVTRWGGKIKDKSAFSILMNKLLLSLRGTPFIYQGDELGLPEATLTFEQLQDPWGKHHWPEWQGRDGCRTPIPWIADAPQAGFSDNLEPWLPIPDDHKIRAVNTQESDVNSVLNQTRKFIAWRKTKLPLQIGTINFIETGDDALLVFKREHKDQEIICIFNLNEAEKIYEDEAIKPLEAKFIEKMV